MPCRIASPTFRMQISVHCEARPERAWSQNKRGKIDPRFVRIRHHLALARQAGEPSGGTPDGRERRLERGRAARVGSGFRPSPATRGLLRSAYSLSERLPT